jgi:hypothetical protein
MSISYDCIKTSYLFKQSRLTSGTSSGFLSKRRVRTSILMDSEVAYNDEDKGHYEIHHMNEYKIRNDTTS